MAVKTLNELTKASTIEDADKLLIGNENGTEYITINDLKDSIDVGGDDTTDIVVDDSISSSSENPVQNKVVHNALLNKANVVHTHSSEDITSLDASKLTGKIDIDRLPAGALERVVSVEDSAARFALTKNDIQLGDTVHELDTDLLYIVSDDNNLDNSGGYIEYTARYVTSVPWSGVTDKPDSYTPSAHTHTSSDITDLGTASVARASVAASAESVDWSDVDNKPSSYNPSTHNHTISQITDIANASVAFADSAGSVDWDDVNDKPSTFTPSTHEHNIEDISDLYDWLLEQNANASDVEDLVDAIRATNVSIPSSLPVGSTTQGVYIDSNGNIQSMSYSLNKSVPSDAVFTDTDTTYSAFSGSDVGLVPNGNSYSSDYYLNGNGGWSIPKGEVGRLVGDHGEIFNSSDNNASGLYAHAEGIGTTASGNYSHAEGWNTTASGDNSSHASHAEGWNTTASGHASHAQGEGTSASGHASFAAGYYTDAQNNYETVVGMSNNVINSQMNLFSVGNGSGRRDTCSNAFRVTGFSVYGLTYNTSGADYAEMFEWQDGNENEEDRIGLFVTLDGDKIKLADQSDEYILGVISGRPAIIGDEGDNWKNMYETDIYGRTTPETHIIEESGLTITSNKVSEEYDNTQEYVLRADRKEWDAVGLVGKLVCIDDGTAKVNGYVYPKEAGIATKSDEKTKFRVMERIDETHIRVMVL